jgi:hypothetical protein
MAAKLTGGMVISVDIEDTDFEPPLPLRPYWTMVKMDTLEFLLTLDMSARFGRLGSFDTSTAVDLVWFDGLLTYRDVKAALEALDTHVSPSTLLLLHDLMYQNTPYYHTEAWTDGITGHAEFQDGGPYRALAELDAHLWEFSTVPVCHGLTILRKKYASASTATLHHWRRTRSKVSQWNLEAGKLIEE